MHTLEIRRASSRGRLRTDWLDAHFSFAFADYADPQRQHFSALRVLNEDRIQPGTGFAMHPHRDMEILMLPLAGTIAHADSLGNQALVRPDELLLMSAGAGIQHSQMNASSTALDHHLQIWLWPRRPGTPPRIEHGRFPASARQGRWQLLASGDGAAGSLTMDQDARIWRAELAAGVTLGYAPAAGRSLYLHVAAGAVELALPGQPVLARLASGDALAWTEAAELRLRGADLPPSDVLLLDLPRHVAR